jgi:hypothetical protein
MGVASIVYPVSLTDKDWQKKKGNIAKLTKKTGIGALLQKIEKDYAAIDDNKLAAAGILPTERDIPNIQKHLKDALAYYTSDIEPIRKDLAKVRDLAKDTAAEWKKSKLIPESSRKAADELSKAADLFYMKLKSTSPDMVKTFTTHQTMIESKAKLLEMAKKEMLPTIALLKTALKECMANPTKAEMSAAPTSVHQRCRSMCNYIRNNPEWKEKFWKTWQPLGDEYHKDIKEGDKEAEQVKAKLAVIVKALAEFEKYLNK